MHTPLTSVLSEDDLEKLRAGYEPERLADLAEVAFAGSFAPAEAFAKAITGHFYAPMSAADRLAPRDRQLVMLAGLADTADMNFRTHVYLSLMEGLRPHDVVNTVYLTALYRGGRIWTPAAAAIADVFAILKDAAARGGDAVRMPEVLASLRAGAAS